jgi:hypothetical protein
MKQWRSCDETGYQHDETVAQLGRSDTGLMQQWRSCDETGYQHDETAAKL